MSPTVSSVARVGRVDWVLLGVFVANLPVPLLLGCVVTTPQGGRVGMLMATTAALFLALAIVPRRIELRADVVVGGICTALAQGFPLPQVAAGFVSLKVVERLLHQPSAETGYDLTEAGGFLATLLTAGLVMAVAVAFGAALRCFWEGPDEPASGRGLNLSSPGRHTIRHTIPGNRG